ncbi:MAG: DUF5009 domain-containing protein [Paludibacter sp.]|nr:DUF5009 domain-containing protein [Paludibacter sp.]
MINKSIEVNSTYRFEALDVFRGLTICFMIIVNTSGNWDATYWPLLHAGWNGFSPADLVFPSFLFAVGNSLSFVAEKWEKMQQKDVLFKIFKRTVLIFIIGYLMYWFPFFRFDAQYHLIVSPISQTRIMGVLQRIALCYGIVAIMIYYLKPKIVVLISILLLFIYWGILQYFGLNNEEYTIYGNAVLKLDKLILGESHLNVGGFEPEGILSTIPALFNVVGGYIVGLFLKRNGNNYEALSKLLIYGIILIFLSYCWNAMLPINKKLWTSSFSVLTVGLDCVVLAIIVFFTNFLGCEKFVKFFSMPGKNPLFIYLLSELGVTIMLLIPINDRNLYSWIYLHCFLFTGKYLGAFLFAVSWMFICWLVSFILDRFRIYIKL